MKEHADDSSTPCSLSSRTQPPELEIHAIETVPGNAPFRHNPTSPMLKRYIISRSVSRTLRECLRQVSTNCSSDRNNQLYLCSSRRATFSDVTRHLRCIPPHSR